MVSEGLKIDFLYPKKNMLSELAPPKFKIPYFGSKFDDMCVLINHSRRILTREMYSLIPRDPLSIVVKYCDPIIVEPHYRKGDRDIKILWHDGTHVLLVLYRAYPPDIIVMGVPYGLLLTDSFKIVYGDNGSTTLVDVPTSDTLVGDVWLERNGILTKYGKLLFKNLRWYQFGD